MACIEAVHAFSHPQLSSPLSLNFNHFYCTLWKKGTMVKPPFCWLNRLNQQPSFSPFITLIGNHVDVSHLLSHITILLISQDAWELRFYSKLDKGTQKYFVIYHTLIIRQIVWNVWSQFFTIYQIILFTHQQCSLVFNENQRAVDSGRSYRVIIFQYLLCCALVELTPQVGAASCSEPMSQQSQVDKRLSSQCPQSKSTVVKSHGNL